MVPPAEAQSGSPAAGPQPNQPNQPGQPNRSNWSGNYTYRAGQLYTPATVAETQEAVRSVAQVRALGTRHAFNGIADSETAQISTLRLNRISLDPATSSVRVGAGARYGDLALVLDRAGYALANLASLPHISVGGACATATHGSGLHIGNLATAVTALEFVAADGTLHTLTRERDGDRFAGSVVALGALGVVTHLTLRLEKRFAMTQVLYENLPFRELEHHLPEIMNAGYSVSLFTGWQHGLASSVWIKRRASQADTLAEPPPVFFNATLATRKLHPLPEHPAEACTDQLNRPGPWYERLPHFKLDFTPSSGQELQTEYFVPFERGYEAIRAVETLRDQIAPHLYITELRAVAADDLWLSMAYRRPSLAIHFTWKPASDAVLQLLPAIEARLAPFHARPHWAKLYTMKSEAIARLYPRLNDFRALAAEFDPQGKFQNDFLRQHVCATN
jgi:xylitol oxidase